MKNQSKQPNKPHARIWLSLALLIVLVGFVRWGNLSFSPVQSASPQHQAIQRAPQKSSAEQNSASESSAAQKKRPTQTPTRAKKPPPLATSTPTPTRKAGSPNQQTGQPTRRPSPTPTIVRSQSGLPTILFEDLPPEAQKTIRLIDQNGPFPFWKDDTEFQNRERKLPRKSRDYYREFTVVTPGENDRGARRIIEGAEGELYYTDDHYESFKEVIR